MEPLFFYIVHRDTIVTLDAAIGQGLEAELSHLLVHLSCWKGSPPPLPCTENHGGQTIQACHLKIELVSNLSSRINDFIDV